MGAKAVKDDDISRFDARLTRGVNHLVEQCVTGDRMRGANRVDLDPDGVAALEKTAPCLGRVGCPG